MERFSRLNFSNYKVVELWVYYFYWLESPETDCSSEKKSAVSGVECLVDIRSLSVTYQTRVFKDQERSRFTCAMLS